ncbi:MAG: hypothetical protein K6G22_10045 [Lachnospiraceae bacterium]|nr:hypothetical protein [Lachnospiraceae bacterium]
MNTYGVLTTQEELAAHNLDDYETFDEVGVYRCRLDCRSWYQNGRIYGLVCYFTDLDEEIGWQGFCFRHRVDGKEIYCPQDGSVDFERVEDGSLWEITIGKNKKGKCTLTSAKRLEAA